jgi:hypothetical protein
MELAAMIYETDSPTEPQRRAVQRAVQTLAAQDQIQTELVSLRRRDTRDGRKGTPGLHVYRPSTAEYEMSPEEEARLAELEAIIDRAQRS